MADANALSPDSARTTSGFYFGSNASEHSSNGTRHFQAFEYFGSPPRMPSAIDGVTVGNTVAELLGTAPGPDLRVVYDAITGSPRYEFHRDGPYYLCFQVPAETGSSVIEAVTAGTSCTYGGE